MAVWLSFGAYFTHFPTPPTDNNFTVHYYFIYFFNNLLTVINIYKYFNIAIEYQIKPYIIHVLSVLKSKIHPVVYYNAVFWSVELLLGYML